MSQEHNPLFTFNTENPNLVIIGFSDKHTDIPRSNFSDIFENLAEHIDQSLRNAGYIYDITVDMPSFTLSIRPFEGADGFNQETFDIIAEELLFADNFVQERDDIAEDEDEIGSEE